MVNRVKLGFWGEESSSCSVQQLWVGRWTAGLLEPGVDTDRVSLVAGSLIREPANGELREQVLNLVQQRSQLP